MKTFWLALFAGVAVQTARTAELQAPSPPKERSTNVVRQVQTARAVVGYLETRNRIITIYAGSTYSIKTKDGKVLAENVSLEALQARFPDIHKLIRTGIAKDGSFLDGRIR